MNIEVYGAKVYGARNPGWTRLGKSGKPMLGLRRNGQIPGPTGIGGQSLIRGAFARDMMGNYGKYYGKDARGMPNIANAAARNFPTGLRKSPRQKKQERLAKAAQAHRDTEARWSHVREQGAPAPTPEYEQMESMAYPVGF